MQVWCSWFNFDKENVMKLEEVHSIAKSHSIKPDKLSKTELIKTI